MFSTIVEEMGIFFGICIVLVCLSCFLMFLNIALQIHDMFYKLIALGLGCGVRDAGVFKYRAA